MTVEASREGRELCCLMSFGELRPEGIGISREYEGFFFFFWFFWFGVCVCVSDSPDFRVLASNSNLTMKTFMGQLVHVYKLDSASWQPVCDL